MSMLLKSRNHVTRTVVIAGSGFGCCNRTWCPVCQVEVIARAVMEQLQEERKDEMAAIRAEICSEVKVLRTGIHSFIRYLARWSMITRPSTKQVVIRYDYFSVERDVPIARNFSFRR